MSTYRYAATNLLTGQVVADQLPLIVTDFSRTLAGIGQPGQLNGWLDLGASTFQPALLGALEPRRTLLWVLQDGAPVWAGLLWDWPHQSAASDKLPILANELGSLFYRRQVRADQTYTTVDLYTVIRNLITYATAGKGASAAVSQLVQTSNLSGTILPTVTFPAANLGKITDLINQFASQYGIEYAWDPGLTANGTMSITLRIGTATTMGRPYSATQLQLVYPGNLADYAWPRTGSAGANSIVATATGTSGSTWTSNAATHGLDAADLAAGYPLLEDSVSYTGSVVTAQSQIDAYADARQLLVDKAPTIPTAIVAGGQTPTAQQILLGDHAMLIASSSLHPATASGPGLSQDVRIIGWTVYPPSDMQPESTALLLGGVAS